MLVSAPNIKRMIRVDLLIGIPSHVIPRVAGLFTLSGKMIAATSKHLDRKALLQSEASTNPLRFSVRYGGDSDIFNGDLTQLKKLATG